MNFIEIHSVFLQSERTTDDTGHNPGRTRPEHACVVAQAAHL